MTISRHNPPQAPAVRRYSQVVRVDLTEVALLFISGLVGVDRDGRLVGPGDLVAQADQVYRNLEAVLAAEGAGLGHVVKTTTYLRDGVDASQLRGRHRFPDDALPASTGVMVSSLADPAWLIEVEAVAVVPKPGPVLAEPRKPDLALVTTDLAAPLAAIVERYASRWAIEVAFEDANRPLASARPATRTRTAVERTAPFGLYTQSVVIIWYHLAGHHPIVVRDRRNHAPWYATKRHPSYMDMIVKLRGVLIAAQYQPEAPRQPTHEEIRAVQLAWAQAAA